MGTEIYEALSMLEKERGVPIKFMLGKIEKSIITACKNNYGNDDAFVLMTKEDKEFQVFLRKLVVEEVKEKGKEINLTDARVIDPNVQVGEKIPVKLDTKEFGRIAAQTARNIIRQGIRDGEREQIMNEFQNKLQEIVSAVIEKIDKKTGAATLRIGKAETTLVKTEQIGTENFREGSYIKVYLADIRETEKGPKVIISRTHPDFVKKLFESEVPEIADKTVEIKSVSREPGSRSKIAVYSNNSKVDAVGSCIGPRGSRIEKVIDELGGEKIDIVEYSEVPEEYVAAALAPSKVISVKIGSKLGKTCHAVVPNNQLSLAIGNKGQNVRLAAKLTGWKIDINPEFPEES